MAQEMHTQKGQLKHAVFLTLTNFRALVLFYKSNKVSQATFMTGFCIKCGTLCTRPQSESSFKLWLKMLFIQVKKGVKNSAKP